MSGHGICPRCGRVVGTMHSKPECDAFYDAAYRSASRIAPTDAEREELGRALTTDEVLTFVGPGGPLASAVEAIIARHVIVALSDIGSRCARAAGELAALGETVGGHQREYEAMRLLGKADGVRLAKSYLDEAVRDLTTDLPPLSP